MTSNNPSQQHEPTNAAPSPSDIPTSRPSALDALDVLVGEWEMEATFPAGFFGPGAPEITDRGGRTSFQWLEGHFFLIQRFSNPHPAAPDGIAIIGLSQGGKGIDQRYYDSRGVARVYHMSLENGTWKLWRDDPSFSQRYTGRLSEDGTRIEGEWEASADGENWKHDFALTYIKAST